MSKSLLLLSITGFSLLLSTATVACSGGTTTTGSAPPADAGPRSSLSDEDANEPSDDTTTRRDAGAATDTDDPSASAGPIKIKNLSVAATPGGTSLTFAIENTSKFAIERVQEVGIALGKSQPVIFPITCQASDWLVPGDDVSGVLEVEILGTAEYPSLKYSPGCGQSYSGRGFTGSGSEITLEVKGLLEDATPWKAQAVAKP